MDLVVEKYHTCFFISRSTYVFQHVPTKYILGVRIRMEQAVNSLRTTIADRLFFAHRFLH